MKHAPIHKPVAHVATRWDRTPEARAAIAAVLLAQEPATVKFETFAITRDEWHVYDGPLGSKVEAIRDAAGEALCSPFQPEAFAEWADVTTAQAIDAARALRVVK